MYIPQPNQQFVTSYETAGTYTLSNPFKGFSAAVALVVVQGGGGGGGSGAFLTNAYGSPGSSYAGHGGPTGGISAFLIGANEMHGASCVVGAGGAGYAASGIAVRNFAVDSLAYNAISQGSYGAAGGDSSVTWGAAANPFQVVAQGGQAWTGGTGAYGGAANGATTFPYAPSSAFQMLATTAAAGGASEIGHGSIPWQANSTGAGLNATPSSSAVTLTSLNVVPFIGQAPLGTGRSGHYYTTTTTANTVTNSQLGAYYMLKAPYTSAAYAGVVNTTAGRIVDGIGTGAIWTADLATVKDTYALLPTLSSGGFAQAGPSGPGVHQSTSNYKITAGGGFKTRGGDGSFGGGGGAGGGVMLAGQSSGTFSAGTLDLRGGNGGTGYVRIYWFRDGNTYPLA